MIKYQKNFLREVAAIHNGKRSILSFTRQMGKTYVIKFIQSIGKVAIK